MQTKPERHRYIRRWIKLRGQPIEFFEDSKLSFVRAAGLWTLVFFEAVRSRDVFVVIVDRIKSLIQGNRLNLHPIRDVVAEAGGWRCQSIAAQFAVTAKRGLPNTCWKIATLKLAPGGSQLHPILGADIGGGHVESTSIQFPKHREGSHSVLTAKSLSRDFLRFSPMVGRGNFQLLRLEVKAASVFGAVSHLRRAEGMSLADALRIIKRPDRMRHIRLRQQSPSGGRRRSEARNMALPAFELAGQYRRNKCSYHQIVKWSEVRRDLEAASFGLEFEGTKTTVDRELAELRDIQFRQIAGRRKAPRIVVYTCIFGDYEALKEPDLLCEGVRYICFTDNPELASNCWEIVQLETDEGNRRRASRLPKLLPHKYLPDHDISIYVDGTLKLGAVPVRHMVSECLGNADMGLYPHYARDCLYDEAVYCVAIGKEEGEAVIQQTRRYRDAGFPAKYGLFENAFIVRKNTQKIRNLNELWWREYSRGSQRDQLSLMYCLWSSDILANPIPFGPNFRESPYAQFTDHEYRAYLNANETPSDGVRIHQPVSGKGKFSFVSALFNKEDALDRYLGAVDAQNWPGEIEVVLVDDCSSDGSVRVASGWRDRWEARPDRSLILIRHEENAGNCVSRNRGLNEASGDAVCIIDADCVINPGFIAAHMNALGSGHDVSLGPMGIELGRRDLGELTRHLACDPAARLREMKLQWPAETTAFVNCVTRNFVVARSFLDRFGEPLFNELFSFRKSEDTGFGWEDVDMGARLYMAGARIGFQSDAYTIHLTHPPEVAERIKAQGSIRNFRRLIERNPHILEHYGEWAEQTFRKIEAWLDRCEIQDRENLSAVRNAVLSPEETHSA